MNQFSTICNMVKRMALTAFISIILFGCSDNSKQRAIGFSEEVVTEQSITEESPIGDSVMMDKGDPCFAPGAGSDKTNPDLDLDKYIAILEADKRIKLDEGGTALVWIGLEDNMPSKDEDVIRDSTSLDNSSGLFARITLEAKNCAPIDPVVMRIEPSSSVRFTLIPENKGTINIYANIEFFEDQACTIDTGKRRATKSLHVKVRAGYFGKLWSDVEDGFSYFWAALVALFFGALLFVIRRFVKEKTGYDPEQNQIFNKNRIGKVVEEKTEVEAEKVIEEENEKEIEQVGDDGNEEAEQETLPADE